MRTSYLFFCFVQHEGEFEKICFVEATKNSLRLFPVKRASFGIMELSFMGMIFPYIIGVFTLGIFVPRWLNIHWILLLGYISLSIFLLGLALWGTKSWQWAQTIAFRYTERRSPNGEEVQVRQVKTGVLSQTLQIETRGRKTTLRLQCRRQTLAKALDLASTAPREEGY